MIISPPLRFWKYVKYLRLTNRSRMVRHLFSPAREIAVSELMLKIFGKPEVLVGRSYVTRIEESSDAYVCRFEGLADPLYYPRQADLAALYRVAAELFDQCHWHYYESPETRVATDDVVVDCGAAEGLFGLVVARRCRALYLIEPLPDYFNVLKQTFAHLQNVTILPSALSDHAGPGYLAAHGMGSALTTERGLAVELRTLDSLFADKNQPVSYIKGDLEGHEMQVLAGAQNTIRRYRPKIAMTTYHRRGHAKEIADYLRALDPAYRVKQSGLPRHPVVLHAWVE